MEQTKSWSVNIHEGLTFQEELVGNNIPLLVFPIYSRGIGYSWNSSGVFSNFIFENTRYREISGFQKQKVSCKEVLIILNEKGYLKKSRFLHCQSSIHKEV